MDQNLELSNTVNTQIVNPSQAEDANIPLESTGLRKDDVNTKACQERENGTILHEKLVYYYSAFDLNVNEWFNEYENAEIFKRRMKLKLGQNWVKYFYQAIEITQNNHQDGDDSEDLRSEETEDFASNQYLNIAIEYYQISAKNKTEENSFEIFFDGIQKYFNLKGYEIIDESLFKSLIHTFHIIAENEEENIAKKK